MTSLPSSPVKIMAQPNGAAAAESAALHKGHRNRLRARFLSEGLDAARFGRTEPPFPAIANLLAPVDIEARGGRK